MTMANWRLLALVIVLAGGMLRLGVALNQPLGPGEAALAWPGVSWLEGGPEAPSAAPLASMMGALGVTALAFADLAPRLPGILLAVAVLAACAASAWPLGRWVAVLGSLSPVLVLSQGTLTAGGLAASLLLLAWLLVSTGRPGWVAGFPAGALLALGWPGLAAAGSLVAALMFRGRPGRNLFGGIGTGTVTALVLVTGLGAVPDWMVAPFTSPGLASWDGALMLAAAYLPAVLLLWAAGVATGGRDGLAAGVMILVPGVWLALPGGLDVAPVLAAALLPAAAIGAQAVAAQLRDGQAGWSWWLVMPAAALVFAGVAGGWIARNPMPDGFLVTAGIAAAVLPFLLLLALVVFGRITATTALAAVLVVCIVIEVRALAVGGFSGAPDLVLRDRGTGSAVQMLAVLESPRFATTRVLPDPEDPLLQWWARQRRNPPLLTMDPALLALTSRPGVTAPVAAGTSAESWDGRFVSAGAAVRWFLAREGVLTLPRSVYLRGA